MVVIPAVGRDLEYIIHLSEGGDLPGPLRQIDIFLNPTAILSVLPQPNLPWPTGPSSLLTNETAESRWHRAFGEEDALEAIPIEHQSPSKMPPKKANSAGEGGSAHYTRSSQKVKKTPARKATPELGEPVTMMAGHKTYTFGSDGIPVETSATGLKNPFAKETDEEVEAPTSSSDGIPVRSSTTGLKSPFAEETTKEVEAAASSTKAPTTKTSGLSRVRKPAVSSPVTTNTKDIYAIPDTDMTPRTDASAPPSTRKTLQERLETPGQASSSPRRSFGDGSPRPKRTSMLEEAITASLTRPVVTSEPPPKFVMPESVSQQSITSSRRTTNSTQQFTASPTRSVTTSGPPPKFALPKSVLQQSVTSLTTQSPAPLTTSTKDAAGVPQRLNIDHGRQTGAIVKLDGDYQVRHSYIRGIDGHYGEPKDFPV
jgi:hypothetical protein